MLFEQDNQIEKFGKKFGYVFAYLLFTTVLFFIWYISNKIPNNWTYLHIMIVTFLIALVGAFIKRFLE